MGMTAAAMADDLTLMAGCRRGLQRVATFTSKWFDLVGIRVNASKTEHIAWGGGEGQEETTDLVWPGQAGETHITQRPAADQAVRILGQKLVPNGSTRSVVEETRTFIEDITGSISRRRLTDRICQMFTRAVLIPTVAYRLMGQPLLPTEIRHIESPMLVFTKHGFKLPSTTPSSVIHHQKGANIPRLEAVLTTRNIDMTTRWRNGRGATFFAKVANALEESTCKLTCFPGAILPNAQHVSARHARHRKGVGRLWLTYLARMITKYDLTVEVPSPLATPKEGILTAFQKPPGDKVLTTLYNQGICRIDQVFRLHRSGAIFPAEGVVEGMVDVQAPARTTWGRLVKQQCKQIRQKRLAEADAVIDVSAIRRALRRDTRGGHKQEFTPDKLREVYQLTLTNYKEDTTDIVVHTDGSLEHRERGLSMGMGMRVQHGLRGDSQGTTHTFNGSCREAPFSSMTAEIMAIYMALSLIAPGHKMEI
ncbi:hypothetical protein IWW45_009255 [Coemansia sp. RSA 485]|nr:hypothetical protein IWW45_009255 [Coemansia sp. RSA 485]